jgi:hypothetical protein
MPNAASDPLPDPDLDAAAEDELQRALSLSWAELARVTPWGDTFEGFSPANRPVLMERSYIWADGERGDILCEVAVFPNAVLYELAARRSARIRQPR